MLRQKLLLSLLVLFLIGLAANAFTQSSVPKTSKQEVTETTPKTDQEIAPIKTEKIDEVGGKIGDKVDRIGETAPSYFGKMLFSQFLFNIGLTGGIAKKVVVRHLGLAASRIIVPE